MTPDQTNIERISSNEYEFRKEVLERLVRVETKWDEHIKASIPYKIKVDKHEQVIQRIVGIGVILQLVWFGILAFFGYHHSGSVLGGGK